MHEKITSYIYIVYQYLYLVDCQWIMIHGESKPICSISFRFYLVDLVNRFNLESEEMNTNSMTEIHV